ncbi:MAG: peptidase M20 [Opitutales bacterium]|nr:peptidase M20 [Opitutales bacterium]
MSFDDPIATLRAYASHPSVSADSSYAKGMVGARDHAAGMLASLGFDVEVVETPMHPILLATRGNPSWPHLVVYGHYDVQPADPFELWTSHPFEPEVRGDRLYGRGVADNKGPQIVHMTALARALANNPDLPLRITYLIEGEEEVGSPSFKGFLEKYKERLDAEMVLVSDTGSPNPEQIAITTGLRGLVALEALFTGPKMDLHSGVHGGPVFNPLQAVSEVCASLHDEHGKVNLSGFYDEVRSPADWERAELEKLPLSEAEYLDFIGAPSFKPAKGYSALESVRFGPTLEFNGIGGGYQGDGSKTVIPKEAFVKITCRLVPDQSEDRIAALVKEAIEERCPPQVTVEVEVTGGGDPYVIIPPDKPGASGTESALLKQAFASAEREIAKSFGSSPIYLREGGSIPIIGDLKKVAGLDSLLIGLFTPADNLHAPDEGFHLGIMEKATEAFERIFENLATQS